MSERKLHAYFIACFSRDRQPHGPELSGKLPDVLEPNPYAPTAITLDTRPSEIPLPARVRRFRLDPARFDRFTRKVFLQLLLVTLPLTALCVGLMILIGLSSGSIATFVVVLYAWMTVARVVRVRLVRRSHLQSYELLIGEHAARRNLAGWVSAEILRHDVTRIVEVPTGLWITCEKPQRSLFVASALEGYDEAKATFTAWGHIDRLTGVGAWRFARRHAGRQGARDEPLLLPLADDAQLAELQVLRHASMTGGLEQPPSRAAAMLRVGVIWFALVLFFLGVWQYFSGPR